MGDSFLNSTLWGAVIGAIGSIAGGYYASKYQTNRQIKIEESRNKQKIKDSATVVYGDIITLIKAMLFYRKSNGLVGFYFAYSSDYSSHIDTLSERIDSDETYLLRRIYGHLVHMHQSTLVPTINSSQINLLVTPNYEAACTLLYGSKGKFLGHTGHLTDTLTEENYHHLTDHMENNIKDLLKTLSEIKLEHL